MSRLYHTYIVACAERRARARTSRVCVQRVDSAAILRWQRLPIRGERARTYARSKL